MKPAIIAYSSAGIAFLLIDLLWLGVVAKDTYRDGLGHLLTDKVQAWAAALFYVLYIAGITLYAMRPALITGRIATATQQGALFGFFCYMTYELTNYALLKDWPLNLVFIDIAWGTVLTSLAASIGTWVALKVSV